MAKQIVLMENLNSHTFRVFNEQVWELNQKAHRIVQPGEMTVAMLKSAGVDPARISEFPEAAPAPAPTPAPAPAPVVDEAPAPVVDEAPAPTEPTPAPVVDEAPAAPDITDWDEDKLRAFTQEKDIPIHPMAKSPGLRAAITRYFEELAALAAKGE